MEAIHMKKGALRYWSMCGKRKEPGQDDGVMITGTRARVTCKRCLRLLALQDRKKARKKENTGIKKKEKICGGLWRLAVWLLWDGKCALCGKATDDRNSHHYFPKGAHAALRYDPYCGVLLCYGCHIGKVHKGGETERLRDIYIAKIGMDAFNLLKQKAYEIVKGTPEKERLENVEKYLRDFTGLLKEQKGYRFC